MGHASEDKLLTKEALVHKARKQCKSREAIREAMGQFGFSAEQQITATGVDVTRENLLLDILKIDKVRGLQVIEYLARTAEWFVRTDLAAFLKEPNEMGIKWFLATDRSPNVRSALAANSTVPIDILERLASDHDETVRYSVASNKKTPSSILSELSTRDKSRYVQQRARNTIQSKKNDE